MKRIQLLGIAILMSIVTVKAATPVDRVVRSVEQRIPDIRQLPDDKIEVKRPTVDLVLPEEALEDTRKRLEQLDAAAVKTLDPLEALPEQLPIIDTEGKTVFIEQQVEDGWRAVASEWLLILEQQEIERLEEIGATILNQKELASLGMIVVRFKVPKELDSKKALSKQLPKSWLSQLARNHIYETSGQASEQKQESHTQGLNLQQSVCQESKAIGLIDTAVEKEHSAFAGANIKSKNFLQKKLAVPTAHGTAVAGILVGSKDSLKPLLPKATLYSASVFYSRNQYSQGATLSHLIEALDWMAKNKVSVINMSLTGPDNPILKRAIEQASARNIVIVAAVGNEGPASRLLYPAAYPEVIAATAVDKQQKIYRWANQGEQIDFAAMGVSVMTARSGNQLGRETGTSMAAPVVSAFVVCTADSKNDRNSIMERLKDKAKDLGKAGKDSVFGYGLLHPE